MEQEMRTFRSRLNTLPLDLKEKLGEVSYQKGMLPTSRRDRINELLNEYSIDFMSLGTGTNRHIVKYDGFAIKIALDKEGIADNRQEWVMADKLAPDVAAAFEISKGGHLLVSEYAPAFISYGDMMLYRESIVKILTKWAKRFLIGDVGIIDKNYANWGINSRGKPVCIDYAYLFPTSMDIFRCICGNKAMAMDDTFSKYICTKCRREYSDAELRMMITQEERLQMFEKIPGLEMFKAEEQHLCEVTYHRENLNPDYPDPYQVAAGIAPYFMNTYGDDEY